MGSDKIKTCTNCKKQFGCTNTEANGSCWCDSFPPIFPLIEGNDCLCPDCLKIETINKINAFVATITPENAKNNTVKDLPQTKKLLEDIDYYIENGNYVFTKWFHLKRGNCCGNGCRHCPY